MGALYPPIIVGALTPPLLAVYLTVIRCDNQETFTVAKDPKSHSRMKPVNEDFVRETVEEGKFVVWLAQHRVIHRQFLSFPANFALGKD